MSATTDSASVAETATAEPVAPEDSLTDKQRRILAYLRDHVGQQTYFKSRLIAEELDLSAKEVGTNMPAIRDGPFDVTVEKWGYSSATTWKVTA